MDKYTPNFERQNCEKKFSCIIRTVILVFVVDESNLNLVFGQLFIGLYWLKIRISKVFILS